MTIVFISCLCAAVVGMFSAVPAEALTSPNYSSSDQDTWTMGYSRNTNGMQRGIQGTNGWYCFYTTQTNRNGSFDTGMMKQALYGKCYSNWRYYGVTKNWTPAEYTASSYDSGENHNWWLMDGNGRVDPHVSTGLMMSGAYGWAAPKDAVYTVSVDYTAGGGNAKQDDGVTYYAKDGVTVSINTASGMKAKVAAPATTKSNPNLSTGNLTKNIRLNAGEMVYIIADPEKNGGYDTARFQIKITVSDGKEDPDDNNSGNGSGGGSGNGTDNGDKPGDNPSTNTDSSKNGGGGASNTPAGVPSPNTGVPSTAEAVKNSNTEANQKSSSGKYYVISAKTMQKQTQTTADEKANSEKQNSGGKTESQQDAPKAPVVIIGLIEALMGGAVFSAGKFFWMNK